MVFRSEWLLIVALFGACGGKAAGDRPDSDMGTGGSQAESTAGSTSSQSGSSPTPPVEAGAGPALGGSGGSLSMAGSPTVDGTSGGAATVDVWPDPADHLRCEHFGKLWKDRSEACVECRRSASELCEPIWSALSTECATSYTCVDTHCINCTGSVCEADTCGCVESCIAPGESCTVGWANLVACYVESCESEC
jgi:hypothetical protein